MIPQVGALQIADCWVELRFCKAKAKTCCWLKLAGSLQLAVGLCHMAAFRNEEELEVPLWLAFRFNDRHRFRSFEPRSVNAFRQQRNRRDAEPTVVARSVLATAAKAAQSGGVAEGPQHVKWSACGGCMGTVLESMWRNVLHIVGNNYDRAKGIFLSTLEKSTTVGGTLQSFYCHI